jgi:hypothetical protein
MIPLEKNKYYKLIDPVKEVTINNLFARSVIEHHVTGEIYVDKCDNPQTYYVIHPYGMSLLFGNYHNEEFNDSFRNYSLNLSKTRINHEWMQAFPNDWNKVLNRLFKNSIIKSSDNIDNNGLIELNTRINFRFNLDKYLEIKKKHILSGLKIIRTDKQIFEEMKGSVVPSNFWDNSDDFVENGIGFSIYYKDKLASTAYSAFIHDNKLELGIETIEEFRGKGLATITCIALIDYCIANDFEPVWACRLENSGSYNLALALGFEQWVKIPYYRLCI